MVMGTKSTIWEGTLYLDTCIVSGLAKEDLPTVEQEALAELLELHKAGRLKLVTSHITKQEIAKIPLRARLRHIMIYNLLENVPATKTVKADPLFRKIRTIVPDEEDAKHLYQAVKSRSWYFVTTDKRTILRHATKLFLEAKELMVMSPSEMVTLFSAEL